MGLNTTMELRDQLLGDRWALNFSVNDNPWLTQHFELARGKRLKRLNECYRCSHSLRPSIYGNYVNIFVSIFELAFACECPRVSLCFKLRHGGLSVGDRLFLRLSLEPKQLALTIFLDNSEWHQELAFRHDLVRKRRGIRAA